MALNITVMYGVSFYQIAKEVDYFSESSTWFLAMIYFPQLRQTITV